MQNADIENQLIIVDIADVMLNRVSIQPDIDETKIKAAEIMAQELDLKRLIGKPNIERCIDPQTEADENLVDLIIPPLCYFTYSRLLKHFQESFSESGLSTEANADTRNAAKSSATDFSVIAEAFMNDVFDFLKSETPNDEEVKPENVTPQVRLFGGKETRSSN